MRSPGATIASDCDGLPDAVFKLRSMVSSEPPRWKSIAVFEAYAVRTAGRADQIQYRVLPEQRVHSRILHFSQHADSLRGVLHDQHRNMRIAQDFTLSQGCFDRRLRLFRGEPGDMYVAAHGQRDRARVVDPHSLGELRGVEDRDLDQVARADLQGSRAARLASGHHHLRCSAGGRRPRFAAHFVPRLGRCCKLS